MVTTCAEGVANAAAVGVVATTNKQAYTIRERAARGIINEKVSLEHLQVEEDARRKGL